MDYNIRRFRRDKMSEPVLDWDRIVHKGVRTNDNQDPGNVLSVASDEITVGSGGARHEYIIPKSAVEGFNGSELFLSISFGELRNYEVKR
ncbi:MAG TPA: hypothetical protein VE818_13305 [Nitrososphaeraceae archaeon]|nr:hypothetical protein [Nitrososphaeraceae archaeon]